MTVYTFPVTYTEGGRSVTQSKSLSVYDNKVSELLFNGTNGGTVFTDTLGRVWTRNGNAQTSTAQFTEGSASCLLDGTGDFLTTPSTTDIQNQGDWRIECAIRLANVTNLRTICGKRPTSGSAHEYLWVVDTSGHLSFTSWDASGASNLAITGAITIALNTWTDVAIEKLGDNYRMLVNNVEDVVGLQTVAPLAGTTRLCIGRDESTAGTGTRDFNGYIDRFRFVRP